jgi:hypothetical protein
MAEIYPMNEEKKREWEEWVATRPPMIQEMCRKFPPNKLYRLKNTGHRVSLSSYSEDGTMTVVVSGEYNLVTFARRVFGIKQEDLEECELPGPDEKLGELLTKKEDIELYIKHLLAQIHRNN